VYQACYVIPTPLISNASTTSISTGPVATATGVTDGIAGADGIDEDEEEDCDEEEDDSISETGR